MATLNDHDEVESEKYLGPPDPEVDGKIINKSEFSPGVETTDSSCSISDLFIGGELVTKIEQELGFSKGNRNARIKLYKNIDNTFYSQNELEDGLFQALETFIDNDDGTSLRNISHDADQSLNELINYSQELDRAGFLNYEDAKVHTRTTAEFAYELINNLEK